MWLVVGHLQWPKLFFVCIFCNLLIEKTSLALQARLSIPTPEHSTETYWAWKHNLESLYVTWATSKIDRLSSHPFSLPPCHSLFNLRLFSLCLIHIHPVQILKSGWCNQEHYATHPHCAVSIFFVSSLLPCGSPSSIYVYIIVVHTMQCSVVYLCLIILHWLFCVPFIILCILVCVFFFSCYYFLATRLTYAPRSQSLTESMARLHLFSSRRALRGQT